jgi:hypothetical protein
MRKTIEQTRLAMIKLSSSVFKFSNNITVEVEVTPHKNRPIEMIANAIEGTVKNNWQM